MAMSRSFGATSFTRRSPMYRSPPVISSSPAIMRNAVLLPQPDGPTRTRNSWSRIWMFRSLTAVTSPYFLVIWSSGTPAIEMLLLCLLGLEFHKSGRIDVLGMRRSFRYRAYPTRSQDRALHSQVDEACRLYNAALEERRSAWRAQRRGLTYY